MDANQFDRVVRDQIETCLGILLVKAREYATDDRLHNFKIAAGLQGVSPAQALAGMMAKHTVSVYDMCGAGDPAEYAPAMWAEKITDSINYLLLLRALVAECHDQEDIQYGA